MNRKVKVATSATSASRGLPSRGPCSALSSCCSGWFRWFHRARSHFVIARVLSSAMLKVTLLFLVGKAGDDTLKGLLLLLETRRSAADTVLFLNSRGVGIDSPRKSYKIRTKSRPDSASPTTISSTWRTVCFSKHTRCDLVPHPTARIWSAIVSR